MAAISKYLFRSYLIPCLGLVVRYCAYGSCEIDDYNLEKFWIEKRLIHLVIVISLACSTYYKIMVFWVPFWYGCLTSSSLRIWALWNLIEILKVHCHSFSFRIEILSEQIWSYLFYKGGGMIICLLCILLRSCWS